MKASLLVTALSLSGSALASSSHYAQHPIQVYLYPSPPNAESVKSPLLNTDQAEAVLAHHFSAGQGVDEMEKLPGSPGDWVHLISDAWSGYTPSGHPADVRKSEDRARVVIVQGQVDVQQILPSHFSSRPSFYLPSTSNTKAYLAPYLSRASHVVEHIMDSLPEVPKLVSDLFDLSKSKASKILSDELSALAILADRIPWLDRSRPVSDRWESVVISTLGAHNSDGEIEKKIKTDGARILKGALTEMTSDENTPPVVLIVMPSTPRSHRHYAKRSLSTAATSLFANSSYNPLCYPSNRTCDYSSSSCSGHGECVASNTSEAEGENTCWKCKCASGYLGEECQKGDYTFQTTLLIFTPLLLLTVLLGSVALLNSVGGEALPSTLSLSMGPSKRD